MSNQTATLIYIHDPMCSWCWGFRPVWQEVQLALEGKVGIQYILGGLAADSHELMSKDMQISIRSNWKRIQQTIPNTEFNYDFWTLSQPRRSTYPACRALIACRMQRPHLESKILLAIQQAYYLEAQNPSDESVLVSLAKKIGLDEKQFIADIRSEACQTTLLQELNYSREMNVNSFPSLVLKQGKSCTLLDIDYNNSNSIINQIV